MKRCLYCDGLLAKITSGENNPRVIYICIECSKRATEDRVEDMREEAR